MTRICRLLAVLLVSAAAAQAGAQAPEQGFTRIRLTGAATFGYAAARNAHDGTPLAPVEVLAGGGVRLEIGLGAYVAVGASVDATTLRTAEARAGVPVDMAGWLSGRLPLAHAELYVGLLAGATAWVEEPRTASGWVLGADVGALIQLRGAWHLSTEVGLRRWRIRASDISFDPTPTPGRTYLAPRVALGISYKFR